MSVTALRLQEVSTGRNCEAIAVQASPPKQEQASTELFGLEEEMVDVIAPIHPEPLLILFQRRPHLRRQANVEEVLDDHPCQRGRRAALSVGHALQFPGDDCGNPCGHEFQFFRRPLSHSVLSSIQLEAKGWPFSKTGWSMLIHLGRTGSNGSFTLRER